MTKFVYVCMACIDAGDGAYLSDNSKLTKCPTCQGKVFNIGFVSTQGGDPLEG